MTLLSLKDLLQPTSLEQLKTEYVEEHTNQLLKDFALKYSSNLKYHEEEILFLALPASTLYVDDIVDKFTTSLKECLGDEILTIKTKYQDEVIDYFNLNYCFNEYHNHCEVESYEQSSIFQQFGTIGTLITVALKN